LSEFFTKNILLVDIIFGDVSFGDWRSHVESWKPAERNQTLLLRYEEMTHSPISVIDKVSKFVGLPPKRTSVPSFEQMHSLFPQFFRKGISGGWAEEFSHSDRLLFQLLHGKTLLDYGYSPLIDASEITESLRDKVMESIFSRIRSYQGRLDSLEKEAARRLSVIQELSAVCDERLLKLQEQGKGLSDGTRSDGGPFRRLANLRKILH
jgi:hypothetical protein